MLISNAPPRRSGMSRLGDRQQPRASKRVIDDARGRDPLSCFLLLPDPSPGGRLRGPVPGPRSPIRLYIKTGEKKKAYPRELITKFLQIGIRLQYYLRL